MSGAEFTEYVLDQLDSCGAVRPRKMFGGTGVYVDDVFCAIVSGSGRFYLRVDESNQPDFEAEEMEQFSGRGDSRMPYFEVPTSVLEDAEELRGWVAKARAAAVAKGTRKKSRAGSKAGKSGRPSKPR